MTAYRSFAEQAFKYISRPHGSIPDAPINNAAAWRGAQMRVTPEKWLLQLSEDEICELEAAAAAAQYAGLAMEQINSANFTLPTLGNRVAQWRETLRDGQGFLCLQGLPVERWGDEISAIAYWGLGHHLGLPGAQNAQNDLLGHVTDLGDKADDPNIRQYRTAGDIGFHCDAADVVGLLCLRKAKEGGKSRIASSVTIFNELFAQVPELVSRLFEPVSLDRRGEQARGDAPIINIPPCTYYNGMLSTFWHGEYFRTAQRHDAALPLTEEDLVLFDLYDTIAASPDVHLDMDFEPGDMQFISNHTTVHARTAYTDHDRPEEKRHLFRLWLSFD